VALRALVGISDGTGTAALQYIGTAALLWATLGSPGWTIQTIGGESLAEVLNERIHRGLHCFGTFLLSTSIAWGTAGVLA
jgi:hypothetical protein